MTSALGRWALIERTEITQDIKWFNAGAKLYSPSGNDITEMKVDQLKTRLRDLDRILRENN